MIVLPFAWSWTVDGWIIAAGVLCAASAALLGNFLVLRRMSLLGDAISHAVLPGLAGAYLLTGERSSVAMFLGAVVVGVLTAFFTEWVHRVGQVDEGASMGVVFTSLFAVGLVMIVWAADHVDLDPNCVLYGDLVFVPLDTWEVFGWSVPRVVLVLAGVVLINALYVGLFFKELRIASFDPQLATASGFHAGWMHYSLMTLVAVTAVASFEAVGNILVVAMLVAPPAAARLLTNRLGTMVGLSVVIAAASAVFGHWSAVIVPGWFGYPSTNTAGMIALATGGAFTLAMLFGPEQGVVSRAIRRRLLSLRVLGEDVLGALYRADERHNAAMSNEQLTKQLHCGALSMRLVLGRLQRRAVIEPAADGVRLTEKGIALAAQLIRSHRLWEHYLVERVGMPPDRIHPQAERLEHITDRAMRQQLDDETSATVVDPHGQTIPDEENAP